MTNQNKIGITLHVNDHLRSIYDTHLAIVQLLDSYNVCYSLQICVYLLSKEMKRRGVKKLN